jgi:2',3'-cyclic-nucleotide 2'-phosphodiesterase (5'-nucleotidase family)
MNQKLQQLFLSRRYYYLFLASLLLLSSCVSNHPVVRYENTFIEISNLLSAGEDSLINATIAPYKSQLDKTMNEVLAVSEQNLFKAQPEGLLGDLVADVILKKARQFCADSCKVDICVLNNGGLRNPLPKGNITRGNIFQLMTFENEIVILTLNGNEVKELFDFIANKGGIPVAGMRMKIKNQMPNEVLIGEKSFNVRNFYTIATSDYLANGGDNMSFFTNACRKTVTGKKIRDAIIEYLSEESEKGNTIKVQTDGRIQIVK